MLYEILQEITETDEILVHPFEKGYTERVFEDLAKGVGKY